MRGIILVTELHKSEKLARKIIERRAPKHIPALHNLTYKELFTRLAMVSLHKRRIIERSD